MNLPLRDIKPNENLFEIWDFWWLLGVVFIFLAFKFKKKRVKINFSPKWVAYNFKSLAKDHINKKNRDLYEKILVELSEYKYKKDVLPLNEELKRDIIKFFKLARVEVEDV